MYLLRNMPLKQCFLGGYISPTAAPDCVGLAISGGDWRLRGKVFFSETGIPLKMCSKKVAKGAQKWYEHLSFLNSVVQKSDWNISFFRDLGGLNLILFIWNVLFFSIFFQQKCFNDQIPNSDGFRVTFRWELSRAFLSQHRLKPPVAIASWQKIVQPFTVPPRGRVGFFFSGNFQKLGFFLFFLCFLRIVPWDGKSSPSNHDLSNPREMAQKNQRDEILCINWIQMVGFFLELWWHVFYSCSFC